jgi:hypothetical protein
VRKFGVPLLVFSGALLLGARPAFAEASVAAVDALARVVVPLSADAPTALRFGNIAAGPTPGTITVDAGSGTRSATGGAVLASGAPAGPSHVNLSGEPSQQVSLTYPPSVVITSGPNSMTASGFVAAGSPTSATLTALGTVAFSVGAQVNVGAFQPAGSYAGTLTVTLSYQ